jgi:hypothetical protein
LPPVEEDVAPAFPAGSFGHQVFQGVFDAVLDIEDELGVGLVLAGPFQGFELFGEFVEGGFFVHALCVKFYAVPVQLSCQQHDSEQVTRTAVWVRNNGGVIEGKRHRLP